MTRDCRDCEYYIQQCIEGKACKLERCLESAERRTRPLTKQTLEAFVLIISLILAGLLTLGGYLINYR